MISIQVTYGLINKSMNRILFYSSQAQKFIVQFFILSINSRLVTKSGTTTRTVTGNFAELKKLSTYRTPSKTLFIRTITFASSYIYCKLRTSVLATLGQYASYWINYPSNIHFESRTASLYAHCSLQLLYFCRPLRLLLFWPPI